MIGMEDSRTSDTLELRELGGFPGGAQGITHDSERPPVGW